jgi:dihydrofolate reductase
MDIKCSVFIATSLDGFIARSNGDVDWLSDGEGANSSQDYGYKEFFNSIDTLVMGRSTYETVLTFGEWPYGEKKVVVLSRGNPSVPSNITDRVQIMSGTPSEVVRGLAASGTRHLYVDGGVTIQGFLRARLIDEMTITRLPILIGEGIPLFGRLEGDVRLEHRGTRSFESGYVQSHYRVFR